MTDVEMDQWVLASRCVCSHYWNRTIFERWPIYAKMATATNLAEFVMIDAQHRMDPAMASDLQITD